MSVRLVAVGPPSAGADGDLTAVSATLAATGIVVASWTLVEEDEAALEQALAGSSDVTVVLAGPGGSSGDVLRRALARATGTRLVLNERMRAGLEEAARRRDRPLDRRAERLALLPQGATVWRVEHAEPAWTVEVPGRAFVVLARGGGVPSALGAMLSHWVRQRAGRGAPLTRTLRTASVSLTEVEDRLAPWLGGAEATARDVGVSTVPADGEVWVRLAARGATPDEAARAMGRVEPEILAALGPDCYGRDDETLEGVVGRLLLAQRLTLAVAESCTGGLLGHRLTSVSGASAYFERGVVVYSNRAKEEMLGVPASVLAEHGAVSAPCAEAMARGICERASSACGLAITGIAGPDGGTPTKPVGTVFVGVSVGGDVAAHRFHFAGDREAVKGQSAQAALDLLRRRLGGG